MKKLNNTIVSSTPPSDKNSMWYDGKNLKINTKGEWMPSSGIEVIQKSIIHDSDEYLPNAFYYKIDVPQNKSELIFNLVPGSDNVYNEYMFEITPSSDITSILFINAFDGSQANITWIGSVPLESLTSETTYIISIANGIGIYNTVA